MNPYSYTHTANTSTETMSTEETSTTTTTATESKPAEDTKTETTNSTDTANQNNNKSLKKVKSKKDLKNDPSRFDPPGVNFNAKLIGIDEVTNARGDKMCQEAMYRLKLAVKQSGQHKQKIIVNVSLDGIRIIDVRTHATNHSHPVHRISFISRDITDGRAFGYVFGAGDGKHKFFAIKTEKAAEALVLTLRDLFQVVYELKKKEVEDAKLKIEEPATESSTDGQENKEPVYQVPANNKPVENGTDPTYQVPGNNQPVQSEARDLLQMETELEVIERRIEQIDTMEELFKELEAPPTTAASTTTPASNTSSWAADFASLSQAVSQPQAQPMFSMGGAPFSAGQPFPPAVNTQNAFAGMSQPGMPPASTAGLPFGAPAQPAGQFGVPQQQAAFGAQSNPFQASGMPPNVPPRTGMGFPGQNFPPTPFPGAQQQAPGFPVSPGVMPGGQPAVSVTPAADPFGGDPFGGNSAFEEGVLMPAKLEATPEDTQPAKSTKGDFFGDLVNIGGNKKAATPKDMFAELATTEKKSLNALKVDKSPSPKPASPIGFQASEMETVDPFEKSSSSFATPDPFEKNDPFVGTTPSPAHTSTKQDVSFDGNVFADDDAFNIPLPQGPPPPLPENIASQNHTSAISGPPPPPRPSMNMPPHPSHNPPLPPRPKSTSSDSTKSTSSLNSLHESQSANQQLTPPLPPRPNSKVETKAVPRPRPRASLLKNSPLGIASKQFENTQTDRSHNNQPTNTVIPGESDSDNSRLKNCVVSNDSDKQNKENSCEISSPHSAINDQTLRNKSSETVDSRTPNTIHRTSSAVADPFVSTDPFASDDPFTQSDPFANDPFASDPFTESSNSISASKDDPFTSVITSPQNKPDVDPFSVFDNTFSNESAFKFDRSSSKKSKAKVSGQ